MLIAKDFVIFLNGNLFLTYFSGFPKVVNDLEFTAAKKIFDVLLFVIKKIPSPSATAPLPSSLRRASSRGMESMVPARQGSFRQNRSPVQAAPLDKPPLAFCKRRLSWPEINASSTSG